MIRFTHCGYTFSFKGISICNYPKFLTRFGKSGGNDYFTGRVETVGQGIRCANLEDSDLLK